MTNYLNKKKGERITAVWQNGGFRAKLNIWFSNEV